MENTVPRLDVLLVLEAKKVAASCLDQARNIYLLAGNGILEARILPDRVPKMELQYLQRKFDIPIHLFWHPEMLSIKPGEHPN